MRTFVIFCLSLLAFCSAVLAEEGVGLEVSTDRELYLEYSGNQVFVQGVVTVPSLSAGVAEAAASYVFVLDKSGSMEGARLQGLRKAMGQAFGRLRDEDRVSLVFFGSEVETLLPLVRKDQVRELETLLAKVEAGGGAALYDALNQGAAQLRREEAGAGVRHLILVTDGPPTKGPLEPADFVRLASALANEGITLSVIGLGEDFEEDCLAAMARAGGGRFQYADEPGRLENVLQSELLSPRGVVGREACLSLEFHNGAEEPEAYGWSQSSLDDRRVVFRIPRLYAGTNDSFLASARFPAGRRIGRVAVVRLQWRDSSGAMRELRRDVEVLHDSDQRAVAKSLNAPVWRQCARMRVAEGLQEAISQLDKGDSRKALKELRRCRDDVFYMNSDLEDEGIQDELIRLERYLSELKDHGLRPQERKLMRSGLFGAFELPVDRGEGGSR